MRIALVADSISRHNGGIAPVMYALARRLSAHGHEVRLFGGEDSHTATDCSMAGVSWCAAPVLWRKGIAYAPSLKTSLHDFAPEIIHVHGIWCYAELVAATMNVPFILSPHGMLDSWALNHSKWKKKIYAACFEHRIFKKADTIHALCQAEACAIDNFHSGKKIVIIPNGVELPSERSLLPTPDGKNELLFLGRLHPKKGVDNLIKAFGCIPQKNWRLVIAGWDQNGYETLLRRLAAENPNADIVFSGPLFGQEKVAAFRRSSAFILPSLSEGLPMAVLEAWSYGLPTLLTDFCNLPEGFYAEASVRIEPEVNALKKQLCDFFTLPATERKKMGLRAEQLVQKNFSWDQVVASYLDLYNSVMKSANKSGRKN